MMPYMTKSDLSALRRRLLAIHAEMAKLLPIFLGREALLPGYATYQPRTCGRPGCRCAAGERHPAWILQFREGGRVRCRSIGEEGYEELRGPAESYRRFRGARAAWNRLMREARETLGAIERARAVDPRKALEER